MPTPDADSPATRNPQLATRNSLLLLSVVSPSGTLLSCPVDSVVIPAWNGLMGILPGHTALLAMLRPGTVNARAGDTTYAFQITGGFADVGPTQVSLVADSAEASP